MQVENSKTERHVLLVVRYFVGGIRTYIKYIYSHQDFDNCRFTIVSPANGFSDEQMKSIENVNAEFITCDENNGAIISTVFNILRKEKIDLVHSHGFTSGICASLPARIFSVPHIITSHDVLLDKQLAGFKGYLKKTIIPVFLNLANVVHCVSHDAEKNLKEKLPSLNSNKLLTILNGIDIAQYSGNSTRDLYSELSIDKSTFIIGFLGRFMSQKGFRYLIDAVESLKKEGTSTEFIVLAIGAGGFIREEKALIKQKNIDDKFIFLPFVDNVAQTIKGVDVIIMPSLWEACPLVPMETLVSGIPLIASNCIGLREVTKDTPTFSINPRSAGEIATAIKECINDNRIEEFRAYSQKAAERFDSRKSAIELGQLYNNLISQ